MYSLLLGAPPLSLPFVFFIYADLYLKSVDSHDADVDILLSAALKDLDRGC